MNPAVASPRGADQLFKIVGLASGQVLNGFIGKLSEMSWLHRAWQHCQSRDRQPHHHPEFASVCDPFNDVAAPSAETLIYFTDEEDILSVDEDYVDACQLPSFEAFLLAETFFSSSTGICSFVN